MEDPTVLDPEADIVYEEPAEAGAVGSEGDVWWDDEQGGG